MAKPDTFANNMPALVAGLISSPLALRLLTWFSDDQVLLALAVGLSLPALMIVTAALESFYRWDDGVIDRFENSNLRPFVFLYSLASFLLLQIGITLLSDIFVWFRAPPIHDGLIIVVTILAIAFFYVPFVFSFVSPPESTADQKAA